MFRILLPRLIVIASALLAIGNTNVVLAATSCGFNVDQRSTFSAASSGALLLRYANGLRGLALTNNLAAASDTAAIENIIEQRKSAFDIDGDGEFTTDDALIASRLLLGFSVEVASSRAAPKGSRDSAQIRQYISDGCPGTVMFPIEVLGPAGYIEARTFNLQAATIAANAKLLSVECHRCGWRDGTVASGLNRGAKASVRLNAGAWIDITDTAINMEQPAKGFGGLSGGFFTTKFTLPITGAQAGANTIEFRFNTNDGFSNGFRVLNFDVLSASAAGSTSATYVSSMVQEDASKWTAQAATGNLTADIAEGLALWKGKVPLAKNPIANVTLKASCSACHASDGRDLKYFNYSDWSITERSKFHGLNNTQGRQLAAYIRSLPSIAPTQARPWNPPYQPGPGLDAKPLLEWSAGAGVRAVLTEDKESLRYLFPNANNTASDLSAVNLAKVIDIKKTINVRETPIAAQMPDWNAWLPHEHPLDLWSEPFAKTLLDTVDITRNKIIVGGGTTSLLRGAQRGIMESWRYAIGNFQGIAGAIPCLRFARGEYTPGERTAIATLPAGKTCEDGMQAINHWYSVKMWELHQEFALEDGPPKAYPYGEPRGWVGAVHQVFWLAPHRLADLSDHFKFQNRELGAYQSMAWYHVQMIVNAGHRNNARYDPQDWFYTPEWINEAVNRNNMPLTALAIMSQLKMYQNVDRRGPDGRGTDIPREWWSPFVHPRLFESFADRTATLGQPWLALDTYEPGLRAKIASEFLRVYLLKQKSYAISALPRPSSPQFGDSDFENIDYVPQPFNAVGAGGDADCYYSCPGRSFTANDYYRLVPRLKAIGVDTALINELIDWCKAVWPQGSWDSLR